MSSAAPKHEARVRADVADFLSSSYAGDPAVGDYVGQFWLGDAGVRVNENSFRCPTSLVGEVHVDSETYAGALWDSFELYGTPMVQVVLDTVAILTSDATLEEAALTTVEITGAYLGSSARLTVHSIMAERGLLRRANIDAPAGRSRRSQLELAFASTGPSSRRPRPSCRPPPCPWLTS